MKPLDMAATRFTKISLVLLAIFACGATAQEVEETPAESTVLPSAAPDAAHITFGSNLLADPCSTCHYSDQLEYYVLGPDNCLLPGTTQWLAGSFIAAASGVPERISAAIILFDARHCPANQVTFGIYTDACYPRGPGPQLMSGIATVPEAPCGLAVARLRNAQPLEKGKKYWVAATTTTEQAGLEANWRGSNNCQHAFNSGAGWEPFFGGTPAFKVQGSAGVTLSARDDAADGAFGGNLFVDPCTGCNYDSNASGFDVRGDENCTSPGTVAWLAVPFIATHSGVPRRIFASIILNTPVFCPANQVTLSLYTDDCDLGPASELASAVATVPLAPCDLAVAKLRRPTTLTTGTKYWVVATTNAAQAGLDATWVASNNAQFGLSGGYGWLEFTAGTPGFLVQ